MTVARCGAPAASPWPTQTLFKALSPSVSCRMVLCMAWGAHVGPGKHRQAGLMAREQHYLAVLGFVCWVHPLFCCAGCPNALLPVFPPAHSLFLPWLAGFELQLQLSAYFQPCMLAGSCCVCWACSALRELGYWCCYHQRWVSESPWCFVLSLVFQSSVCFCWVLWKQLIICLAEGFCRECSYLPLHCFCSYCEPGGRALCWDTAFIVSLLAMSAKRIADKLWLQTIKGSVPQGFVPDPGLGCIVINDLEKQWAVK